MNGAVLVVLIVAVMVVTAKVMVPPGRWENLWRDLPARALQAGLPGGKPCAPCCAGKALGVEIRCR